MKKYAPYILIIFIVFVGLFSPMAKVNAAIGDTCTVPKTGAPGTIQIFGGGPDTFCQANDQAAAVAAGSAAGAIPTVIGAPCTVPKTGALGTIQVFGKGPDTFCQANDQAAAATAAIKAGVVIPATQTAFENEVTKENCDLLSLSSGCFKKLFYYGLYVPSAFILLIAAKSFNALISITLNSALFSKSTFIPTAWAVVRDLSNIFFILILLYIAVKVILDLGGHDAKKMIAKVIIIALLINFSMFFSQVVVDSSNILALIFYNKLNVNISTADGKPRPDTPSTDGERDVSGAMYYSFDPTTKLGAKFFEQAKIQTVNGQDVPSTFVPAGIAIGVILVSVAVMLFAAYCFFMSGISFLSRMIELWILIIFSPFALMSFSVPLLEKIEYIGWDEWFKRILKVSFMAPIFMFFMYFIFLLLKPPGLLGNLLIKDQTWIQMILSVVIPAAVILILLRKATSYAKKASGTLGEMLLKGSNMVTGFALGAATGGLATLGRISLGRAGAGMENSKWLKEVESGRTGANFAQRFLAARTRDVGKFGATSSFDVRGVKVAGKTLAGATGIPLGEAQKGGFTEMRKKQTENRQKRAEELKVGKDDKLTQDLHKLEEEKQGLLTDVSHDIEILETRIDQWRKKNTDASTRQRVLKSAMADEKDATKKAELQKELDQANEDAITASNNVRELNLHRSAIKNGERYTPTAVTAINQEDIGQEKRYDLTATSKTHKFTYIDKNGQEQERNASINDLEDFMIPEAHHHIEKENRNRTRAYAKIVASSRSKFWNSVFRAGTYSVRGADEAAHNIIMENKIENKKGDH